MTEQKLCCYERIDCIFFLRRNMKRKKNVKRILNNSFLVYIITLNIMFITVFTFILRLLFLLLIDVKCSIHNTLLTLDINIFLKCINKKNTHSKIVV